MIFLNGITARASDVLGGVVRNEGVVLFDNISFIEYSCAWVSFLGALFTALAVFVAWLTHDKSGV